MKNNISKHLILRRRKANLAKRSQMQFVNALRNFLGKESLYKKDEAYKPTFDVYSNISLSNLSSDLFKDDEENVE